MLSCNTAWNVFSRKRLLITLSGAGWDVTTMAAADTFSDRITTELSLPFISLPMESDSTSIIQDFRLFLKFLSLYRKYRPAIVLHINNKPNIYGTLAANMLGIPSISNITGLGIVAEKSGIMKFLVYALYRSAFSSKNARVFFQNNDDREFFLDNRLVAPDKTTVIPGSGVDTNRFAPSGKDFSPSGETCFLYNGRLLVSKGIEDFIEAARKVKTVYPRSTFVILGEHDTENPIFIDNATLVQAVEQGTVVYRGTVENVIPEVAMADCVVLPSRYREGVPRALLEAASMGKPLIAANSVGTREPVSHEKNGYLVPPADIDALKDAMIRFIELPLEDKKRFGAESRRIAVEHFADSVVIGRYTSTIEALTGRSTEKDDA